MLIFGGFIDSTASPVWSMMPICQNLSLQGTQVAQKARISLSQRSKPEKNVSEGWTRRTALQYTFHSQWSECSKIVVKPTADLFYYFVLQKFQGAPAELRTAVYNVLWHFNRLFVLMIFKFPLEQSSSGLKASRLWDFLGSRLWGSSKCIMRPTADGSFQSLYGLLLEIHHQNV